MKTFVVVALSLTAASCASDKQLVANAAASYTYHQAAYDKTCVQLKGPSSCAQYHDLLVNAKWEIGVADQVYQIGKLPKDERAALENMLAQMLVTPWVQQ